MKSLAKRIEENLQSKTGKILKKYEDVISLLEHPNRVIRPCKWRNRGRNLSDNSLHIQQGLNLIGVDFNIGNDAPRNGKEGCFIVLSQKGKAQARRYIKSTTTHN